MRPVARLLPALASAFLLLSCDGRDQGPPDVPPPPPPPGVAISVSPADVAVLAGTTHQFSCTVTGSSNTQCIWSVREAPVGGTMNVAGLYTAPSTAGVYTVVATAAADQSRTATAIVRVSIPTGGGDNVVRPGLGNDPGSPVVTQLRLPDGVQIDGSVIGTDAEGSGCSDRDAAAGSGAAVRTCVSICMNDRYVGTGPASIRAEPGMMITSDTGDGQHGLMIEEVWITVPYTLCTGGYRSDESDEERRRRFILEVGAYCLNASRSPSFDRMLYALAGFTADPDLRALLGILSRKRVESDAHRALVQEAIYEITESTGLRNETRTRLEGDLPNS